jgi:hypothetical protein
MLKEKESDCRLVTTDNSLRRLAVINGHMAYSFSGQPSSLSWMKKGSALLIAIHVQDSTVLKIFPARKVRFAATVQPFVLYYYIAE